MPIKDLLWACPLCHQIESIAVDGRCGACGARFARAQGARIRATTGDGADEQDPVDWLAQLPWPDLDCDGRELPAGLKPPFRQPVELRIGTGESPLRYAGALLGFIERFGKAEAGELQLSDSEIQYWPAPGRGSAAGGAGWPWSLAEVTAIQPSSSAIQLKARGRPVVSLRFPQGSLRLWEQRLLYCVRRAYRAAGKGEITEFQPCIRTR